MFNQTLYSIAVYGVPDVDLTSKQLLYSETALPGVGWPADQFGWYYTAGGDRPVGYNGLKTASNEGYLVFNPEHDDHTTYSHIMSLRSHDWVEVSRYPDRCTYDRTCDGAGYGHWFQITSGSGVWVNIGINLMFIDSFDSSEWVKSTCTNNSCAEPECGEHEGCYDYALTHDEYFCAAALKNGYESIITRIAEDSMSGETRYNSELVICTSTNFSCSACPPVELRAGPNAELACDCDEKLGYLNCGRTAEVPCTFSIPSSWRGFLQDLALVTSTLLFVACCCLCVIVSFGKTRTRMMRLLADDTQEWKDRAGAEMEIVEPPDLVPEGALPAAKMPRPPVPTVPPPPPPPPPPPER